MNVYIATFYTHLSAQLSCRNLQRAGCSARMMPVPRALSSSCGTCVRYEGECDQKELLDADVEALYQIGGAGDEYRLIWRDESQA